MLLAEGPRLHGCELCGGLAIQLVLWGSQRADLGPGEQDEAGTGQGGWADDEPNLPQVISPDGEMASQQFL